MKSVFRLLGVAGLVAGLFYFPGNGVLVHGDANTGSVELQAEVRESSPDPGGKTPSGKTTPLKTDTKTASSNVSYAPPDNNLDNPVFVPDEEIDDNPADDEGPRNGWIYVTSPHAQYHWSINPFGGSLDLSVSIHNASPEPVDAMAVFEVHQIFGGLIGSKDEVKVLNLRPGESKVITGHINDLAQWALVLSSVNVSRLGDDAWGLGSVTRDHWVFYFPWFIALILFIATSGLVWWRVRRKTYRKQINSEQTELATSSDNEAPNDGESVVEAEKP